MLTDSLGAFHFTTEQSSHELDRVVRFQVGSFVSNQSVGCGV